MYNLSYQNYYNTINAPFTWIEIVEPEVIDKIMLVSRMAVISPTTPPPFLSTAFLNNANGGKRNLFDRNDSSGAITATTADEWRVKKNFWFYIRKQNEIRIQNFYRNQYNTSFVQTGTKTMNFYSLGYDYRDLNLWFQGWISEIVHISRDVNQEELALIIQELKSYYYDYED
jgi:hypothetical protein